MNERGAEIKKNTCKKMLANNVTFVRIYITNCRYFSIINGTIVFSHSSMINQKGI